MHEAHTAEKSDFTIPIEIDNLLQKRCSSTRFIQNSVTDHKKFRRMPTVLKRGPYRFFFVSLDYHEPPHIHVRRENMVAKFWLDPVGLQKSGGFSRAELNKIAGLVQDKQEYLLERWHEFFGN
jgi:hypothetical protein